MTFALVGTLVLLNILSIFIIHLQVRKLQVLMDSSVYLMEQYHREQMGQTSSLRLEHRQFSDVFFKYVPHNGFELSRREN